ncbi:hypothetical protein BCR43DRAFT_69414 [Syncephalastrum racemosum]|uniref:Uncharacterized protein n=1 Tax=Syncephalastrum racemosum TaxID=13706 RepID=A0A1X2HWJ2_SYNRA|nr:hypothetical protein BCR43DRAFT_69414 [Syncephalastrum racemosum]
MHKSPFQNLLSADFLTQVLPLHMPPPSLSDPDVRTAHDPLPRTNNNNHHNNNRHHHPHHHHHRLSYTKRSPSADTDQDVQSVDDVSDDDDNSDDDRVIYGRGHQWKSDGDDNDDDDDEDDDEDDVLSMKSSNSSPLWIGHHPIGRRRSLSSFSKSQTPSTSTTASSVLVPSPPRQGDVHQVRWMQTIAQLRRSLVLSTSAPTTGTTATTTTNGMKQPPPLPKRTKKKDGFIPMPPAPRRPPSQRRRSEATTQPRFNPETNTYTRDTRSNPDHLRMISSELNMMRARKLLSPLKPRGFLPRRKDPFVRGSLRRTSHLRYQLADQLQDDSE